VLNAKGGEIKAKANGSANHLWILKIIELEFFICPNALIAKFGLLWGEFWLWEKGGVFGHLNQFYSWNISLCAQTSVFDLEIGKWIWFAKTNQVVAKSDPNMPNHKLKHILVINCFDVALFNCFLMCWHKSPKRGRLKGKYALGQFL
jgi:hypothetical protein